MGNDPHHRDSATFRNGRRDDAEVSRGHSRSAKTEGPNIATTWRSPTDLGVPLNPTGRGIAGGEAVTSHEFCGDEPPTADPHGGWCGGWELETPGYPFRLQHLKGDEQTELLLSVVKVAENLVPNQLIGRFQYFDLSPFVANNL